MWKNLFGKSKKALKKVGLAGKILVAGLVLGASLLPLSQTVAQPGSISSSSTKASTPRFNFLPNDVEMMQESKKDPLGWTDPITANNNEQVAVLLYFHNGVVGTTAHNTKFRVTLPSGASTKIQMTSSLWSDETAPIYDTIVNGQIVGNSGGTINVTSPANIRYVPGSTKIYRNGSQTGEALPDGITSANGVNIGDIQGCWQYSGYVSFLVDLYGNSKVSLVKQVANPGEPWRKQVTTNPGATVSYLITLRNDGDLASGNVRVVDQLAPHTSYINGTTYLYTDINNLDNGVKQPDTITTSGLTVGNIQPNGSAVYFKFKAKVDSGLAAGTYELVNIASVFAGTTLLSRDQAKVIVSTSANLILEKEVYDPATRSWQKSTSAEIGQVRTFRITVKNSGNAPMTQVSVRDILPIFSTLASPVSYNGQNLSSADQAMFFGSGLAIGTLNPGQQAEFTFQVKTVGCPPIGETIVTNTAYAVASGIQEVISSAQIRINMSAPVAPVIH